MNESLQPNTSPKWGPTLKLVVGLTFVAIAAALLIFSRPFIGPLLLAFILTYMLYPFIRAVSRLTRLPYRLTVNLIYLLLVILVLASATASSLAIIQEIQNLIGVVQKFINDFPNIVRDLSTRQFAFGPFQFNMNTFDLAALSQQILSYVSPLLSRLGGLLSSFATGAAATLGWGLFILIISYFVLVDAGQVPSKVVQLEIPGYDSDIRRIGKELTRIWNAFVCNQLIITSLIVLVYTILLTALGVHYSPAIALLAGLAKFVPYVGPFTTWTVTGLVTFFQGQNYFGLLPWQYTVLVLVLCIVVDQIFDNLVSPRLVGQSLGVHPAAVLIAAFIAASLIGLIGLILAAPVLATLTLLGRYAARKMLDLDPWAGLPEDETLARHPGKLPLAEVWKRTLARMKAFRQKGTS